MANEIFIYDEIGPEAFGMVGAKTVVDGLAKFAGQPVTVRINSPGGYVDQGLAMYNAIQRHDGDVTIAIDALAASAASFVAMAGKRIEIAENALVMVHNVWTITMGDKNDHQRTIDRLDKWSEQIDAMYVKRTGIGAAALRAMLDAETWLTAAEAVAMKFADAIAADSGVAASAIKEGRYRNTPASVLRGELPREQARKRREQDASLRLRLTRARFGR